MLKRLPLSLLFLASVCAAAVSPEMRRAFECLWDLGSLQVRVGHNGELGEREAHLLKDLFKRLKEMMPGHEVPEELALELLREGANASYDRAGLIQATLCFRCEPVGSHLPLETVLSIVAHEYGHAVFSARMKKELSGWTTLIERSAPEQALVRVAHEIDEAVKEMRAQGLIGEHENPYSLWAREADRRGVERLNAEEIPIPLFRKWVELTRTRDKIAARMPSFTKAEGEKLDALENASRSYDELFADSVAVLLTGDPKAMVPEGLERPRRQLRDFSQSLEALEARPGYATVKQEFRFLDAYSLLAPVRAFLWREYFSKPEYKGKRGEMLERLLRAVVPEIQKRLAAGTKAMVTEKEINDSLMDAIRREFRGL